MKLSIIYFLMLGFINSILSTCDFSKYHAEIGIEFERDLTNEEFVISSDIIQKRLKVLKIKSSKAEMREGKIFIKIKNEKDIELAKKVISPQGEFGLMEVYDNQSLFEYFWNINQEIPFILDSTINLFEILNHSLFEENENQEAVKDGPVSGLCYPKDTALLIKVLKHPEVVKMLPENLVFYWKSSTLNEKLQLFALNTKANESKINQRMIDKLKIADNGMGVKELTIQLDKNGAEEFRKLTEKNTGKYLAIVLDETVLSSPMVILQIPNGMFSISGLEVSELQAIFGVLFVKEVYPIKVSKIFF